MGVFYSTRGRLPRKRVGVFRRRMTGSPGIYRAHGQPGSDASRPLRPVRPGFTGHPVTWAQSRGLRRTMPPDAGAHFHTQSMSGKFVSGYHSATLEGVGSLPKDPRKFPEPRNPARKPNPRKRASRADATRAGRSCPAGTRRVGSRRVSDASRQARRVSHVDSPRGQERPTSWKASRSVREVGGRQSGQAEQAGRCLSGFLSH